MSTPRVAVTTGANSGIGLATAVELARRGLCSVGTVRSPAKAEIVAEAARAAGVVVDTVVLDVTDEAACREVVERFEPYAVVNNAGLPVTGAIEDIGDEEARCALETMVVAPMRLARLALPAMRVAGAGRVVNVSSVFGLTTVPLTGWYQACKHALEAASDALRAEVAAAGVRVVLVEPGGVRTGIWTELDGEIERRAGSRYDLAYRRLVVGTRLAQPVMRDPSQVARVIARAVTARAPRARYLVGCDAQAGAMLERITPTVMRDRVTRAFLGL